MWAVLSLPDNVEMQARKLIPQKRDCFNQGLDPVPLEQRSVSNEPEPRFGRITVTAGDGEPGPMLLIHLIAVRFARYASKKHTRVGPIWHYSGDLPRGDTLFDQNPSRHLVRSDETVS